MADSVEHLSTIVSIDTGPHGQPNNGMSVFMLTCFRVSIAVAVLPLGEGPC
jgi:hypothetical protein